MKLSSQEILDASTKICFLLQSSNYLEMFIYTIRATEHKEQEPNSSPHSSDSVYCGDIIKFFDASGRQIVRDKNGYDPMRNYRNQWITVQFKIEADSIPDTAGFHIYTEASSLDKQEVYISNFKVSAVAPMEDQTINPIIKEEWEVDFEDIWN